MQRAKGVIVREWGVLRLYRDDLVSLIEIMRDNGERATFQLGGYVVEGPEELSNEELKLAPIQAIEFSAYEPYVNLIGRSNFLRVSASPDDIRSRGIVSKLAEVLDRGRRRTSFFASWRWLLAYFVLLVSSTVLFLTTRERVYTVGTVTVVVLYVVAFGVEGMVFRRRRSEFLLIPRAAATSFWSRNREALIVNLIVAVVSVILTLLVTAAIALLS